MSEKKRALKPPSEAVLRELADLLEVPEVKRSFWSDEILENVRNTCELKELSDALTKEKSAKMHRSALALQETLWDLNRREAKFIDQMLNSKSALIVFNKISSQGIEGLKDITYQLARFFALFASKPPPRPPSLGPAQRKRGKSPGGRRPGSIYNPIFQDFVFNLWLSTKHAGGNPSFARSPAKGEPQGSILKAIKKLAPHLPHGFVPNVLPARMLQDLIARWNKLEAQYEELEAETSGFAGANTAASSKRNTKSRRPNN
jgi:hypothetical protein